MGGSVVVIPTRDDHSETVHSHIKTFVLDSGVWDPNV